MCVRRESNRLRVVRVPHSVDEDRTDLRFHRAAVLTTANPQALSHISS